jgi:hypothetical protein
MTVSRGVELVVDSLGMTTALHYLRFLFSAYLLFRRVRIFIISHSVRRMRCFKVNTPIKLNNFFFLKSCHNEIKPLTQNNL